MLNDDSVFIPVDDAIVRFHNHLLSHERIVLSAKFGDGKSFFLNEFKKKCANDDNSPYEFITLYPVNYQVLENKDIFELIKHDVLLQILQLGIIDVDYKVSDEMAFAFYLQNNFCTVAESLFSMLSSVGFVNQTNQSLFGVFLVIKWLKSLKDKVNEFKKEVDQTVLLDDYFAKFDKTSVYENDIITKIIRDNIITYERRNNKKVVLIIEDMDRLDPAHLFRIMNVFSAHMDYGYRNMSPIDNTLFDNKFGVSNVVFVMHEDNTKALFHHFYGEEADYDGYMSKFYNKDIFKFSLEEEKEKYAIRLIVQNTGLDVYRVTEFFDNGFLTSLSMRKIVSAMDKVDEQFQSLEVKEGVKPDPQLLRLLVIAKRVGISNDYIVSKITQYFSNIDRFCIDRLLPLLTLNPKTNTLDKVYVQTDNYGICYLLVEDIKNNGLCSFSMIESYNNHNDGEKELKQKIANMLSLLG